MVNFGTDIGLSLTTERTAVISDIYVSRSEQGYAINLRSSEPFIFHSSVRNDMTVEEANASRLRCQKKVEDAKRRMKINKGLFKSKEWKVA